MAFDSWRELRRRQLAFLASVFVGAPVILMAAFLLRELFDPQIAILPLAGVGALAVHRAAKRLAEWPCPRCGKSFSRSEFSATLVAYRSVPLVRNRCANCELQTGE